MREIVVRIAVGALLLGMIAAVARSEPPSDNQDIQTTIKALKARIRDQERRLAELESRQNQQRLEEARREEIRKVVKELNLDASKRSTMPKWLENLKFYGDLRLRYQGEYFSGRSRKTRNRARFRLRIGFKKTWLEKQMEVGFRLASGSSSSPTSTNQTFDGSFSEKHIWIDLAYAKYSPKWLKGFTIIGGKMKKPFVHTDLVWDSDLNPEGVWGQYKHKLRNFEPFAGVGYFVVEENNHDHDAILVAYQAGFNWKLTKDVKWTCAATYYDYDHIDTNYLAASGNDVNAEGKLAAGKFHMINLTNKVGFKVFDLPVGVYFDWIHNCGDSDSAEDYDDQSDGFACGIKVGKNKKKGDWSCGYKYAYIEANCTPGEFNDSDFWGANRKGHTFGAKYNLTDSLTIGAKVLLTEPVTGPHQGERDTTVQVDLVWKF